MAWTENLAPGPALRARSVAAACGGDCRRPAPTAKPRQARFPPSRTSGYHPFLDDHRGPRRLALSKRRFARWRASSRPSRWAWACWPPWPADGSAARHSRRSPSWPTTPDRWAHPASTTGCRRPDRATSWKSWAPRFNGLLDRLQESFEQAAAIHRRRLASASYAAHRHARSDRGRAPEGTARRGLSPGLEGLAAAGHHLRRIVEALLFLARADSEGRLAELEPIDLAAWLPEHLESWARTSALERSGTDRSIERARHGSPASPRFLASWSITYRQCA